MAAVLTATLNLTATKNTDTATLNDLPMVIGGFTGTEFPVEQSIKDILETPNILMRDYVGPENVHINLTIVYYEQYRVYFHMPEGCMTGRGSVIVASEREIVAPSERGKGPLVVNKLVLKQAEGNEYVLYSFVVGDLITPSYPRMRFKLMMEHLKRKPTGAALVRFSAKPREGGEEETMKALKNFIKETVVLLPPILS